MNRDEQQATLELLWDGLSGLDFIARREVLKGLLKSGALFRLAGAGGAGVVASLLRSTPAWAQDVISDDAMSEAGPDWQFDVSRLWFGYGAEGALEIIMGPLGETGHHCRSHQCAAYNCDRDGCSHLVCPDNYCDTQSCPFLSCGTDGCGTQGCTEVNECDYNDCGEETGGDPGCTGTNLCDRQSQGLMDPAEFLDRYGDTAFARDLKKLFGDDLIRELNDMLKTGTSLRDRGLLGPGALTPTPPGGGPLMEDLPSPSDAGGTGKGAPPPPPSGSGAGGGGLPPLRFGPERFTPKGMQMRPPPPPSRTKTRTK